MQERKYQHTGSHRQRLIDCSAYLMSQQLFEYRMPTDRKQYSRDLMVTRSSKHGAASLVTIADRHAGFGRTKYLEPTTNFAGLISINHVEP